MYQFTRGIHVRGWLKPYVLLDSAEYDKQRVDVSESGVCWLPRGRAQSHSVGRETIPFSGEKNF